MLIIRLYGALLTIGSLGACADEGVGPEAAIMMLACGITCLAVRDGLPALRAVGVLLTLAAVGMVGDGGFAQKAAVAVMAAAVLALRTESARCLGCGADGGNGAMTFVYMRVSSRSQNVASQRREIERYLSANGMTEVRWFVDEGVSGAVMERPALDKLRKSIFLGSVDTVVVYALDRLARNAVGGMTLLADWLRRGVRLVVITLQIDFAGEVGQMIAALLLHIAQMERTRIRERQAAGIAAARSNGKRWGGRKPGTYKADPKRVLALRRRGLTNAKIAAALGVSTRTVTRMAKAAKARVSDES